MSQHFPILIITGIMIWFYSAAWIPWLIHIGAAIALTPLILGHIYMATVNPDTRKGITGMVSGYVDRQWAKHHYGSWYREHFERNSHGNKTPSNGILPPDHRMRVECPSCTSILSVSWAGLLQKVLSVQSFVCPKCHESFPAITAIKQEQDLQWILSEFEKRGMESRSGRGRLS